MNTCAVHSLRVNVKSLAAEARFIREELGRTRDQSTRESLSCHRMGRLKPEARLAQLALAYAKGKPYKVAEAKTKRPVDAARLTRKLERFMPVKLTEVGDWLVK